MALTTDEETELLSLQGALLKLRTGQMPSRVVYQGHDTTFSQVNLADVKNRVAELETKRCSRLGRTRGGVRFRL